MRASDNDIKRNVYMYDNRNNNVCVHYEKKGHWKFDCFDYDKF